MHTFNRDSDEIYGKNFKITMREDNLSFLLGYAFAVRVLW